MRKQLIEIIVNKNWEAEPFMAGMQDADVLDKPLVWLPDMGEDIYMSSCRAEYHLQNIDVIVRCIQDMMNDPDKGKSNSEEKYRLLPDYIASDKPDIIVSVSTAESTPEFQGGETGSQNGSVAVGGKFFMFDARQYDPKSESRLDVAEFQESDVHHSLYDMFRKCAKKAAGKFKTPDNQPAAPMEIAADPNYVSLGVVNVENYVCYKNADPAAYEFFKKSYKDNMIPVSIETTHGIVRMSAKETIPVLFVSPIVDRYEKFDDDVKGNQNYVAGYNAGVAVAYFLSVYNQK